MKKYLNIMLAAWAVLCLAFSCNKEIPAADNPLTPAEGQEEVIPSAADVVTISAKLTDVLTRVDFEPSYSEGKPTGMALTWAEGDVVRVYNHADRSQYDDFTLAEESIGLQDGTFTGTPDHLVGATSYDVEVSNGVIDYDHQIQPKDGVTTNLKYFASARNIEDYTDIVFTDISGILAITAKMPEGVAGEIKSVELISEDAFLSGLSETITIELEETGDEGDDGILHFFANLGAGDTESGPNTILVRFYAPDTEHTVYTRYIELDGTAVYSNKLNTININATQSDKHAGTTSCDGSTAEKAYLIGDKYQLQAAGELMTDNAKTYFKMVSDVDMDSESWTHFNEDDNNAKAVDFNGNGKIISHLDASLFHVLKGSVYDLTLDLSSISEGGILAESIQGSGNEVTNVTVSNGSVNSSGSDNVGGLIGHINNGTEGAISATITNCTVSNTNVIGDGVVGGVIGFVDEWVIVSGCTYSGGTVTASERYCGGAIGSVGEFNAVVTDCHVNEATITSSSDRVGGFIGQLQKQATIKGCTVGTDDQRVTIASTLQAATVNAGGFAGVCYGTITQNGDVRNKAFARITCTNTTIATNINIGGFAGYFEAGSNAVGGLIEFSDSDVLMESLVGHQVGGFVGYLATRAGKIDHCTSTGTVSGNNYIGGFIGNSGAVNHTVTNNSSAGNVSGAASVGGFAGRATQGTWTNNTTSCTVTGSGANIGGFAGQINGNVAVSRCSSTGTSVTANGNVCGGFAAIAANGASISDSFSITKLLGGTRKRGGMIGHVSEGTVSIDRCYATGDISANFELGGLVGTVSVSTFTLNKCAAWNSSITASSRAANNWSSAAIIGVADLNCTLTDNFRKPDMVLTAYWGTDGYGVELTPGFQQPDVSSSSPLTDWNGTTVTSSTMRPYNGKCETGKTLSQLASTTLGWSSEVWDFSGPLPLLK